jgi:hypothetical protein
MICAAAEAPYSLDLYTAWAKAWGQRTAADGPGFKQAGICAVAFSPLSVLEYIAYNGFRALVGARIRAGHAIT